MDVIPVLDLMGGQVVHARRGERDAYRPIASRLTPGSDPLAIVAALMAVAPFRRLYVADLDAIRGRGGHDATISALAAVFRDLEFWVDRGESDVRSLQRRARQGPGRTVVGTESFDDAFGVKRALWAGKSVLSLDHDASGPLGPREAHDDAKMWPSRVIVMTLARVGADAGPDFERLADVVARAGDRQVYAAGGIRGLEDLTALAELGVAGALVASALHDGRLTSADLAAVRRASLQTPRRP
ncbi:HisA/HisF-related TIM barrel protein [Hansschlegelia sp. KR7-227]|uniref:HisA/HisF-related TIM barrel protein n=1 Tax=Hansschlegelia sp. KR7-227 TaxID=3400914 RepID=UPI003C0DA98F